MTTMSSVQLLRKRHSSPRTSRWGHLPRQTTARASGQQRPAVRQSVSNFLRARSQYLQENLWTTTRFRTASYPGRRSDSPRQAAAHTKLRQASAMALPRCVGLSIRHGLGRKLRRSHEWSPILGRVVPLPLSPARSAMRGQGRSKSGIASLLHVKLSPSALGPTGERQEHLDARVSFAGASQKRRLFRGFDIFMIKWATAHSDARVLAEIRLAATRGTQ